MSFNTCRNILICFPEYSPVFVVIGHPLPCNRKHFMRNPKLESNRHWTYSFNMSDIHVWRVKTLHWGCFWMISANWIYIWIYIWALLKYTESSFTTDSRPALDATQLQISGYKMIFFQHLKLRFFQQQRQVFYPAPFGHNTVK